MLNFQNWTIAIPLIATIFALGRAQFGPSRGTIERWFNATALTLAVSTLIMVALLSARSFRLYPLLLSHTALAVIAVCLTKYSKSRAVKTRPLPSQVAFGLLILVIAIIFRLKPSAYLFGGQDPGVYMNAGNYIAQHGTRFYTDTTLPVVRDDPKLLHYYLKSTYLHADERSDGSWSGNLFGGLYIHDLRKGESVFQFYPGTEMWLALGSLWFGPHRSTWIFLPFSLLTILAVGLLTQRLTQSSTAGFFASALLAINPAHATISTSSLSEATACFFFLSGLYCLVTARQANSQATSGYVLMVSALSFGALFFCRITGFLSLPLLLVSLVPMAAAIRQRRTRVLLGFYGFGCFALYLASFLWGITFSFPYSRDIFRGKLGVSPQYFTYVPLALCVCFLVWLMLFLRAPRWQRIRHVLRNSRNYSGFIVVTVVLSAIAWKGYQLGFTDTFADHRWFSRRWQMSGQGWQSIAFMSISALSLIMSPLGLFFGLCGVALSFRKALTSSPWIPVCILTTCFLLALTLKQLTVPYMYYYARYQVSELLPLLIITGACFVHHLIRKVGARKQAAVWVVVFGLNAIFLVRPALARLKETEGLRFSLAMGCIDALSSDNTILAVDKSQFLTSPIVTPLRLTYGKKTVAFHRDDFPSDEALRSFFEFFARRGHQVLVVSTRDTWSRSSWFSKIMRLPVRMRKFAGWKGRYRLPQRFIGDGFSLRVFRYLPEGTPPLVEKTPIPPVCEGF